MKVSICRQYVDTRLVILYFNRGYWHQRDDKLGDPLACNLEPFAVKDKDGRPQEDLLMVHRFHMYGICMGGLIGDEQVYGV